MSGDRTQPGQRARDYRPVKLTPVPGGMLATRAANIPKDAVSQVQLQAYPNPVSDRASYREL